MSQPEVLEQSTQITAYNPFRAQLAELAEANSKAVFNYEDPDGNKEARSHVFQLRKTKTAVDKARKAEKEQSLAYGRLVDSEAKEIVGQLEAMIDVHQKPLKAIEDKEKARIAAHEEAYGVLENFALRVNQGDSSATFKAFILELKKLEPDERFEEYMAAAMTAYKKAMGFLETGLAQALKIESEAAELEKLRAEKVEHERIEREKRIARDATEKAELEAQENVDRLEREKQESLEREENLKKKAEQDRIDAIEREKKAVADAEARAKRELEEKAEREKQETQKREANKKHKEAINKRAMGALVAGGMSKSAAESAITLIAKRDIPNVSISY